MSRRSLAAEVLSDDELAEYEAQQRMEARPMTVRRSNGVANSDGWSGGEFKGIEGHWDGPHWRGR